MSGQCLILTWDYRLGTVISAFVVAYMDSVAIVVLSFGIRLSFFRYEKIDIAFIVHLFRVAFFEVISEGDIKDKQRFFPSPTVNATWPQEAIAETVYTIAFHKLHCHFAKEGPMNLVAITPLLFANTSRVFKS
ncbi:hypothetical protein BY458DRAFT_492292 [Sporodiniella umbellata]|nr:hypothetical protein BY458DRAFT_492292 [Sporodiniella umbellata]